MAEENVDYIRRILARAAGLQAHDRFTESCGALLDGIARRLKDQEISRYYVLHHDYEVVEDLVGEVVDFLMGSIPRSSAPDLFNSPIIFFSHAS